MKTPLEEQLAREEQADHARAVIRGQRLLQATREITSGLVACGILRDVVTARGLIFHVLADTFYSNLAVDIPADFSQPAPPGGRWPDLVAAELDKKDR